MNISLPRKLQALVQERVRSGSYSSASEVVREGLRLLEEREDLRELRLVELRREIAIGESQAARGEVEVLNIPAIKAKARRHRARTRSSK